MTPTSAAQTTSAHLRPTSASGRGTDHSTADLLPPPPPLSGGGGQSGRKSKRHTKTLEKCSTSAHTETHQRTGRLNMPKNPYDPTKNPRSHTGAQALINTLTNHPEGTPRTTAQRIIEDTGLAAKTADNIIIRMNATHVIRIIGRKKPSSGLDNRTNHVITRGPKWNHSHTS